MKNGQHAATRSREITFDLFVFDDFIVVFRFIFVFGSAKEMLFMMNYANLVERERVKTNNNQCKRQEPIDA